MHYSGRLVGAVSSLSFLLICGSCAPSGPTDQLVEEQVHEWLDGWWCPGTRSENGPRLEFNEHFLLQSWQILDRLIEDKKATVVVEFTVVTRDYDRTRGVVTFRRDGCFSMVTGGESLDPGDVFTWSAKGLFQKFESGWRLDEWQEGSQKLLSRAEVAELELPKDHRKLQGVTASLLSSVNGAVEMAGLGAEELYDAVGAADGDVKVALTGLLVPRHLKSLPDKDGWGYPIEYLLAGPALYARSPGSDGEFSFVPEPNRPNNFNGSPVDAHDADLVIYVAGYDGIFVAGPDCLPSCD